MIAYLLKTNYPKACHPERAQRVEGSIGIDRCKILRLRASPFAQDDMMGNRITQHQSTGGGADGHGQAQRLSCQLLAVKIRIILVTAGGLFVAMDKNGRIVFLMWNFS